MRRHVTAAALTLVASALAVGVSGPAEAEPAERATYDRARKACRLGVVGVDSQRRVRTDLVKDGQVTRSHLSTETLPFDVTAWGYFDQTGGTKRRTLQLNAVSTDGKPRNVTLKESPGKLKIGRVRTYKQRSFTPRLFADGGLFFAYTVEGGTLKRWTLYKLRGGGNRFDRPQRVAGGFKDWTSLQAGLYGTVNGVVSEILYGTTSKGELRQVVVPIEKPGRARVKKLAKSGYEGVTEISWGRCGPGYNWDVLVTIAPAANRATWTTIKKPTAKPKAKLRGLVTGATDWNLSAAF